MSQNINKLYIGIYYIKCIKRIIKIMPKNSVKIFEQVKPCDPVLDKVAKDVTPDEVKSPYIQELIDFMLQLAAGKGHKKSDTRQMVGLAAPQVGASVRIITIDVTADGSNKKQNLEVFINPVLVKQSAKTIQGREGCWSCGDVCGIVERSEKVTINALDKNGKPISRNFEGFIARIAQHEVDHLNGIRFPERIPLKHPERLHWVKPEEFQNYRSEWMHWANICPRERWDAIKAGTYINNND